MGKNMDHDIESGLFGFRVGVLRFRVGKEHVQIPRTGSASQSVIRHAALGQGIGGISYYHHTCGIRRLKTLTLTCN